MSVERRDRVISALADGLALAGLSLGVPATMAALVSWDAWFLRFLFSPAAAGVMAIIAGASFFAILRGRAHHPLEGKDQ